MTNDSSNVGVAFALVLGAGAATAVGAAVVFVPRLVQYANRQTLASALGLSAGVMTYVSFVEIFRKSVDSFRADGISDDTAYSYATLCFFGGVVFMVTLNYCVSKLVRNDHPHSAIPHPTKSISQVSNPTSDAMNVPTLNELPCCGAHDPIADLEAIHTMATELQQQRPKPSSAIASTIPFATSDAASTASANAHNVAESSDSDGSSSSRGSHDADAAAAAVARTKLEDEAKLLRMSINTAIAIGLHNFPEGLATFVAALHDPKVGAVLALAIAIHNIPEGLCVALPIYYATGQRWKAFGLAVCSGISEPIAALFGWAILANSFSNTMYAVLFGLVAGMMVIISVRELLPTAHRYDPEDSVVTYSYIAGMCIMALSLVLFVL